MINHDRFLYAKDNETHQYIDESLDVYETMMLDAWYIPPTMRKINLKARIKGLQIGIK